MTKDKLQLTSVKVHRHLFDEFKVECVRTKFSLQKLHKNLKYTPVPRLKIFPTLTNAPTEARDYAQKKPDSLGAGPIAPKGLVINDYCFFFFEAQ